ncbi:MAG: site-specific integrase [Legionellaceae bacterium]|nr:site-specific integrase [Legionellaceae bacterium]
MTLPLPCPLFDNLEHLHLQQWGTQHTMLDPRFQADFERSFSFLKSYTGSQGTFNSYRREVERLLQWAWRIQNKILPELRREDIEAFIRFCQNPPKTWIGTCKQPRFLNRDEERCPNPAWRPFIATLSKTARKQGQDPSVQNFYLSQGSLQEVFAILSTFFQFLISEEYVLSNPVALIRQKSKFLQKRQDLAPIRRLSLTQWHTVLDITDALAQQNPQQHERTYFMLNLLFSLYLRISELTASKRHTPLMNDFSKDTQGNWWFTTIGKGNKTRQIAVSDDLLKSLIRYRTFLQLPPLPSNADTTLLIPKLRGKGPVTDTAGVRRLIQRCFDLAENQLRAQGKTEEADNLSAATVHWLRHTGISEDVKIRPREHVRDDAGHASSATTDRYIDVERLARHASAKKKAVRTPE